MSAIAYIAKKCILSLLYLRAGHAQLVDCVFRFFLPNLSLQEIANVLGVGKESGERAAVSIIHVLKTGLYLRSSTALVPCPPLNLLNKQNKANKSDNVANEEKKCKKKMHKQ